MALSVGGPTERRSVSTRIVFDGSALSCHDCGASIDPGTEHKHLSLHGPSTASDYVFCDGRCLENFDR